MKKLLLIIITFTLLLSRSSTLASALSTTFICKYDGDVCNLKPGQENACPGLSSTQLRTLCFSASCNAGDHGDESILNCPGTVPSPSPTSNCPTNQCVPNGTSCYEPGNLYCSGDKFCCVVKNPPTIPPSSQDCYSQSGECRLQSLGCSSLDNEKGVASQQCKAMSNSTYSYMCCVPTNPAASNPPGSSPPPIDPGGYNSLASSQCTGRALADYMNAVITGVKGKNLTHIKLLSPAFNMTSDTFSGIISGMDTAGANFAGLDGIAGNLYDVAGRGMSSWLDEKTAQFPASAQGKSIYLTEAGAKDVADKTIDRTTGLKNLNTEINKLIDRKVLAINLFNAFGTNSGFSTFALSHNQPGNDDMYIACGGTTCPKPVGVNSAANFSQAPTFYSDAKALNMGFTVEIARAGSLDAAMAGITSAHNNFMTPIIRIGVGMDSGGFDNPQTYVDFLASIDSQVSLDVFAIAGPNEPDSEFWAAPSCQSITPAKGSPLAAGFTPLKYKCDEDTRDKPEFHPLRPYPGSPCDPLIPRSAPEAPLDPNLKYNTFACGSSLTPSKEEVFDPYGDNTQYENLPPIDGKYVHTWCEPRPPFTSKTQVTCYRTSEFDVTVDFKNANLGILGNTQDNLTDAQKVNEYLSWYLTGTPQIGDQLPIDPKNPADISRVVNFSGPLRKLMPYDLTSLGKTTVSESNTKEVHNYLVGCGQVNLGVIGDIANAIGTAAGAIVNLDQIAADLGAMINLAFDPYLVASSLYAGVHGDSYVPADAVAAYTSQVTDPEQISAFTTLAVDIGLNSIEAVLKIISAIEQLNTLEFAKTINCAGDPLFITDQRRLQDYAGLSPSWIYNLNPLSKTINDEIMQKLFQNVPFSSMEDIPGEVTLSVFRDERYDQQSPNVQGSQDTPKGPTAPLELIIKSATLAK